MKHVLSIETAHCILPLPTVPSLVVCRSTCSHSADSSTPLRSVRNDVSFLKGVYPPPVNSDNQLGTPYNDVRLPYSATQCMLDYTQTPSDYTQLSLDYTQLSCSLTQRPFKQTRVARGVKKPRLAIREVRLTPRGLCLVLRAPRRNYMGNIRYAAGLIRRPRILIP
jgi:hypothetical protein